jgi:hypothetical protein
MGNVNIRIRDEEEDPKETKPMKMGSYTNGDEIRQEKFLDLELEKRKWKNRRKMAWVSLVAMIVITLALLFAPIPEGRLKIIAEPVIWSYFAFTSVIGAYMGFTTYAMKGK